jgi:glycosyltransferase involved in cell wall biosynthesis
MRIGLVSVEYPPFHGGGIGTYAAILSRHLARAGHDVHVVTNAWKDFAGGGEPDPPGVAIHRIDAFSKSYEPRPPFDGPRNLTGRISQVWESSLFWSTLVADKLEELHRERPLDVVEFPECYGEANVTLRRRRLGLGRLDFPVTLTLHTPAFEAYHYNLMPRALTWIRRRIAVEDDCIPRADHLSSPSRALAEKVAARLALDPARHPCDVIPNPMDFGPPPEAPPAPAPGDSTLLFVGRLEPRKGPRVLVDAAVALLRERARLRVELVGEDRDAGEVPGPMSRFLRSRIPRELADRFVFAGRLPRERVLERYARATACVFPAPFDNFPYTCCEALSRGACVVAGANGGMSEIVEHERSGLLFDGSVDGLARALRRILGDPALAAGLRARAPARVRELCDPDRVVPRRIEHYARTIERFRAGAAAAGARAPSRKPAGETIAVLCRGAGDGAEAATIASAGVAAERAKLAVTTSLAGGPAGERAATRAWLDGAAAGATLLLVLEAGDLLDPDYLAIAAGALATDPRAAWATTWIRREVDGELWPYAGFDFSAPLELVSYHPIPFAVVRREAFAAVGGWNLDLPVDWREWDLRLAFEQAGLAGIVAPVWAGNSPRGPVFRLPVPEDAATHERIRAAIAERNRALFARHVVDVWLSQASAPAGAPIVETLSAMGVRRCARTSAAALRKALRKALRRRLGL